MRVGQGGLRVLAGAGTVAVVGASTLLVSREPRPAAAPLHPPVATPPAPALVIPASCGQVTLGGRNPATGAVGAGSPAVLSPAAQQALAELSQATTKAAQRQVLLGLSAADRQAVVAYLRLHASAGPTGMGCETSGAGVAPSGSVAPQVTDGGPVVPVISTYVS
jgi:hypothetical protein